MSADYKERLRRLALHDDHLIRSMLVIPLVMSRRPAWVTPITGVARVVAAAPEFALALASLLAASERTAIVAMPFTSSLLDGEMSGVEQVQLCI
jgi:hypothetical protein